MHNLSLIMSSISERSRSLVCNTMVENPIYDGGGPVHLYESILQQLETTPVTLQVTDSVNQTESSSGMFTDHLPVLQGTNKDCYVNQSIQVSQVQSQSLIQDINYSESDDNSYVVMAPAGLESVNTADTRSYL